MRALDFPRDADDRAGLPGAAAALRHHGLAQMLQAAEDVLNLLSQEGVFVDELPMEPVDPGGLAALHRRHPRRRGGGASAASATSARSSAPAG